MRWYDKCNMASDSLNILVNVIKKSFEFLNQHKLLSQSKYWVRYKLFISSQALTKSDHADIEYLQAYFVHHMKDFYNTIVDFRIFIFYP